MGGGNFEEGDELMGSGFNAGVTGTGIGGGTTIPTILHGQGVASFGLDGLGGADVAGGGANDNVGEKITTLDGGASVEEFYAFKLRFVGFLRGWMRNVVGRGLGGGNGRGGGGRGSRGRVGGGFCGQQRGRILGCDHD